VEPHDATPDLGSQQWKEQHEDDDVQSCDSELRELVVIPSHELPDLSPMKALKRIPGEERW
jgi:hypothetical protein